MANPEYLAILKQGVDRWNEWRKEHPDVHPDFREADLGGTNLQGANLSEANLSRASLARANLSKADLQRAHLGFTNLRAADLSGARAAWAVFREADLRAAKLNGADLGVVDIHGGTLGGATLSGAKLDFANLREADLTGVDLSAAEFARTIMADVDLSTAKGLETVRHMGPSTIGIDTIYRSRGKIPEVFLRGCGVPDEFIAYIGSMVGRPIEFYSCFISYSTKDQQFADRLYADLQNQGVRCWFAPHDIHGGRKLHEQIDEAIRLHDKLLLILSEHSMSSEWSNQELCYYLGSHSGAGIAIKKG
jgi:uncharacterized protein YjbI with pentapeptide repeats